MVSDRGGKAVGGPAGPQATGTPPVEFRPPAWLRVLSNVPLLAASALLLSGGVQDGGGTLVFGAVMSALMLVFVARSFMLKISAGDDVTVVNWKGSLHFPWSDVVRFEYDRAGLWLTRRNNERVAVKAFAFGRALKSVQAQGQAVAEQLEAIRKARRGPSPARGPKKKKKR